MMNHMCHINLKPCITNIRHASLEIHVTGKQVLSCPQNSLFILSNWIIQIAKKCRFSFQDGDITSYNHSYACVLELVRIYGPWNVRKVSCDCVAHQVQVQSVSQLLWHCDDLLTDKRALHVWKRSLNHATCPFCVISDILYRSHFLNWRYSLKKDASMPSPIMRNRKNLASFEIFSCPAHTLITCAKIQHIYCIYLFKAC
jgi:hypothetical protein